MRKEHYKVLNTFSASLKLSVYDMELILKSLEFYLIVIRQQYHGGYMTTEEYDDTYFDLYCLWNIFNYRCCDFKKDYYHSINFELYKRIDKKEKFEKALERFKVA